MILSFVQESQTKDATKQNGKKLTDDNDLSCVRAPADVRAHHDLAQRLERRLWQVAIRRRIEFEQRLLQRQRRLLQRRLESVRVVTN
jgi:hypothetical protein